MSTKKNGNPEHLHRLNELIRDHCTAEWRDLMGVHNERLSFKKGEQVFSQGGVEISTVLRATGLLPS